MTKKSYFSKKIKMNKVSEILSYITEVAPIHWQESYDNSGLLVGDANALVDKVLLTLDLTEQVIDEAIENSFHLVISHHPLIFKGIKKVNSEDFVGRRILSMLQTDVCYYAMHTNFDVMGMADAAADKLSLEERKVLEVT